MRAYPAHTERKGPTRQTPEPSPRMHGFYIRTLAHAQPPHALLLGPTHLTRANQTTCRCSRSPKSPRRLRCSHNGRRLGIQGETLEVETAPPPNADTSLATVRESSSSHFPYAQLSGALKKGYGCVLVLGRLGYVAAIFAVARRGADLGAQKARMWLCNAAVRYVVSYAVETHRAKSNLKCAVKSQYLRPGPCARLPHRTRLTTRRSRSTRCNHARSLHLCPALGRRPPRIRSTVGACSGGTSRSRTAHTPRLRTWSTRASQSTRGKRRRRSSHIALGAAGPSVLRPPSASARAAPREPLLTRVAPASSAHNSQHRRSWNSELRCAPLHGSVGRCCRRSCRIEERHTRSSWGCSLGRQSRHSCPRLGSSGCRPSNRGASDRKCCTAPLRRFRTDRPSSPRS
jgi:hypothetical protein